MSLWFKWNYTIKLLCDLLFSLIIFCKHLSSSEHMVLWYLILLNNNIVFFSVVFSNLSLQFHIDGHLDHWQIFAVISSVSWWHFISVMRCSAGCWVLAPLDSLFFSNLVNAINAQGLLPLKKELKRGLPTPYSSWFELKKSIPYYPMEYN